MQFHFLYIDPGSGSYLVQIIIAAALGVAACGVGLHLARAPTARAAREPMARRALAFAARHRGAAERMAGRIAALL